MKNPKIWQSLGEGGPDIAGPLYSLNCCSDSDCHSTATEKMSPTLLGLRGQENTAFKPNPFTARLPYHYKYCKSRSLNLDAVGFVDCKISYTVP